MLNERQNKRLDSNNKKSDFDVCVSCFCHVVHKMYVHTYSLESKKSNHESESIAKGKSERTHLTPPTVRPKPLLIK